MEETRRDPSFRLTVLMLPWLAYGHISPFLELAKRLADNNLKIYLCSTPINLSPIKHKITPEYSHSIHLVELHLPSSDDLPPHRHTTNGLPPHLNRTLSRAFRMSEPAFSDILDSLSPDLLIYDFNQPWVAAVAQSRRIPSVLFLTSSAAIVSFGLHVLTKPPAEKFPFPEIYMRGSKSMRIKGRGDSSSSSDDDDQRDGGWFLEMVNRSCVILIKSFREMEEKYIDLLSGYVSGKKVMPVGPIVDESSSADRRDHELIFKWLDGKDEASTVFVSFGSEYFLSGEEIEEVAHGLELAGGDINFIWVLRSPTAAAAGEHKVAVEELLPAGFVERVAGRGLVVEDWAPQVDILAHSSTGGFVTHCGWNSVLESVKLGVPIIAVPMHLDQPINARVATEVGVGLEVVRDECGKLRREVIADVIRKVVVEESGEGVRVKAKEFSRVLKNKGDREIDGVVDELIRLC